MSTRREVLITGAAIATSLLATGCSRPEPESTGTATEVDKADVPVGGGLVLADAGVVVTQPVEGTFVAFSAVCTHQGCTVKEVRPEGIYCACHGSTFDAGDGSVVTGPATSPLPEAALEDRGDVLVVAT